MKFEVFSRFRPRIHPKGRNGAQMTSKWSQNGAKIEYICRKIHKIHVKLVAKTSIETREEFLGNWGGVGSWMGDVKSWMRVGGSFI